ncbi:hypothetical protein ACHAXA_010311 [Cyclostephanos tholiformis]|jgi:hypothetical protein|uniref:Uncharacterized protein n=1 Tax=Cyclostephanos tholiformis TaxID=382380 RepID=A0ABD3RES3_9STRA
MMASFGMLTASIRSAPPIARSIASKSSIGFISLFSTAPSAASKKSPPPDDRYGRFTSTTTLMPSHNNRGDGIAERLVWKSVLEYTRKKQNENINNLQYMLESLRIARMPSNTPTTVGVAEPPRQQEQKGDYNDIQWTKVSLRIALLPRTTSEALGSPFRPHQHQRRTFQVMNRNARKPKRANHGKRPCSRIRRRYKVKKWANTCRKG